MKNNSNKNPFDIVETDALDDTTYDFIDERWLAFDLPNPDNLRLSGPKRNDKEVN